MWFSKNDITHYPTITLNDLHGYVLPHAGTKFTGNIIGHTLRFRPSKKIKNIIIFYYPSSEFPNINGYYHEYYVLWKSIEYVIYNYWKSNDIIKFIGYNVRDDTYELKNNLKNTIIVISADFSHYLPFKKSILIENAIANSIMFKCHQNEYIQHLDDIRTFKFVNQTISPHLVFQWIGRTRSPGKKAVGYSSFLIRDPPNPIINHPDGIFVTVFDQKLNPRECLGQWYNNIQKWSIENEDKFVNKVIHLSKTTSRLTSGKYLKIPVSNYTITYLYHDKSYYFIRGWHGILHNAFYLPNVFLEHTFENGQWIRSDDNEWKYQQSKNFDLSETLDNLNIKANIINTSESSYQLYSTSVVHQRII